MDGGRDGLYCLLLHVKLYVWISKNGWCKVQDLHRHREPFPPAVTWTFPPSNYYQLCFYLPGPLYTPPPDRSHHGVCWHERKTKKNTNIWNVHKTSRLMFQWDRRETFCKHDGHQELIGHSRHLSMLTHFNILDTKDELKPLYFDSPSQS